jgi:hypothetical protein
MAVAPLVFVRLPRRGRQRGQHILVGADVVEEALAAAGLERTCLGYDVLVKIKMDALLEREDRQEETICT